MNERILRYLRERHPLPSQDERAGAFRDAGGELICAQDRLACVVDACTADTCVFYGVSSVPVPGWEEEA